MELFPFIFCLTFYYEIITVIIILSHWDQVATTRLRMDSPLVITLKAESPPEVWRPAAGKSPGKKPNIIIIVTHGGGGGGGNSITNISIIVPQTQLLSEIRILVQSFERFISILELFYIEISPSMTNNLRDADCKIEGLQV